jgi:hypothetical protein
MQKRLPAEILGHAMSNFIFIFMELAPFAAAVANGETKVFEAPLGVLASLLLRYDDKKCKEET